MFQPRRKRVLVLSEGNVSRTHLSARAHPRAALSLPVRARESAAGTAGRVSWSGMRFEPLIRMSTAWTSVFGRFAIHLFEGRVTVEDMELLQTIGQQWNVQHPGKRVELVVVLPSETRMTTEERTRMARLIKLGEAHRAASATVILAEGILASMQRSMLTGMMMLAPSPHPTKVSGTLEDAAKWLYPHLQTLPGPQPSHEEFSTALNDQLASFKARPDRIFTKTG
jgi:hypothetical protein